MRFRKKPVEIEAVRFWNGNGPNTVVQCLTFCDGKARYSDVNENDPCLYIETLEGDMKCPDGDWIIRGVQNEYYPCKPDIFLETYELLSE